jgi:hypothetical protein
LFAGGGDDFGGKAGEIAIVCMIFCCEDQRDETGLWLNDFQIELPGEIIAEGSGAEFGNGESTGGDDESGSVEFGGFGDDREAF